VRIGTRSVALVFTDLAGSTAMYETLGDAAAYGVVRDHFRVLRGTVEEHGGVVVKTIGDAVMASFHSVSDAFAAAVAMRQAFQRFLRESEVAAHTRLNVGVHVGPALVVHTDAAGMDYFGRTVNIAARAQSQAREGALVFTEAVRTDPRVQEHLLALGAEPERFDAELKGLGEHTLYRLPGEG
jgi:class 3 adenylate cyclase